MGQTEVHALRGVSLTICEGEYVAIVGASGSGKSTLMNMIGLLDRSTSGSYRSGGEEVSRLSRNRMADLRNREIGFVFQSFNLLARTRPGASATAALLCGRVRTPVGAARSRRCSAGWATAPTTGRAGGSSSVAIARSVINLSLLLADEPTGVPTLGPAKNSWRFRRSAPPGMTLVVVTHDDHVAHRRAYRHPARRRDPLG